MKYISFFPKVGVFRTSTSPRNRGTGWCSKQGKPYTSWLWLLWGKLKNQHVAPTPKGLLRSGAW